METCADIRGSFWLINKMARVTVMTPILLMFCAKTHLMEELAAFIRYVTWLDSDTFIGFMQCLKQHMDSDLWQALALAVFGLGNIQNVNRYSFFPPYFVFSPVLSVCSGYGFVDFDSPAAAQKAVASLKASGVQAQMAKVSPPPRFVSCYRGVFSRGVILQVDSVAVWRRAGGVSGDDKDGVDGRCAVKITTVTTVVRWW